MNIWTYWEGHKPRFIDVCLHSMQRVFGNDLCVVTPENIHKYGIDLHRNFEKLGDMLGKNNQHMVPAVRAGCIRAALLATHGGWWFDADTIGLKSPRHLVHDEDAICTMWTNPKKPPRIMNGYIYMVPTLASEWLRQINDKLGHLESVKWCSMGEGILTPLLKDNPKAVKVSRELFLPVDIDSDAETFFRGGYPQQYITPDTICFGLNCSYMLYWHRHDMKPPWNRNMLIHRLLREYG